MDAPIHSSQRHRRRRRVLGPAPGSGTSPTSAAAPASAPAARSARTSSSATTSRSATASRSRTTSRCTTPSRSRTTCSAAPAWCSPTSTTRAPRSCARTNTGARWCGAAPPSAPTHHRVRRDGRPYAFVGAGAVVKRDVPDFALMAGVPARQIGWMSRFGERLPLPVAARARPLPAHRRRLPAARRRLHAAPRSPNPDPRTHGIHRPQSPSTRHRAS
jgi:hypothetical protein